MRPIRVLVVDDSAVVRKILSEKLATRPDVEVVGAAPDPYIARDKILALKPDVLTLDIEMPRMDGLSFLRKLMKYHPMPVVILSSLSPQGSRKALEAIEAGAVDVMGKPGGPYSVEDVELELAEKIRVAARAKPKARHEMRPARPVAPRLDRGYWRQLVAVGASTGGTEALRMLLEPLPAQTPPVVVVQHMPPGFTAAFAKRLDELCRMKVREAADGERLAPGTVLVAPGDYHMLLRRDGGGYAVSLKKGPKVFHQRPSVDVLFQSAAEVAGSKAVGIILTGMGKDGAFGLLRMRQAGATTLAQDESTSVVYGMPREAARLGAADKVLAIDCMAEGLLEALTGRE